MNDFRGVKQLKVGKYIMTLLVYVVPILDKLEFRETHDQTPLQIV